MNKQSAGILPYRKVNRNLEFFLVHPGGPFWARKDLGSWSIPKGEFKDEIPLTAAKREFGEETSISIDAFENKSFIPLTTIKLKSGKTVFAFGLEMNINPNSIKSNTFNIGSQTYPEIDKGQWFGKEEAVKKINPAQKDFIFELINLLQSNG